MPEMNRRQAMATVLGTVAATTMFSPISSIAQQEYPTRPIKLVLGFPPGGAADLSARRIGEQIAKQLGQPVVVENRPGASGNIAATYVARGQPDGYTLFYGSNSTHAMNVSLYSRLDFDPVKDFEPIVLQGKTSNVLSVHPAYPVKSLREFIEKAKAEPGRISVASGGNATSLHMALELLKETAAIDVVHIPYRGSAAAVTDVIGGQVPAIMDNVPSSLPFIKSGKLRPLAVTSRMRLAQLPDVPTFDELGLKGYEVAAWGAFWAPAGTPRAVIARLNQEMNIALKDPQVMAVLYESETVPQGGTPEELAFFAREETAKWARVIRRAGIRIDQ